MITKYLNLFQSEPLNYYENMNASLSPLTILSAFVVPTILSNAKYSNLEYTAVTLSLVSPHIST